MLDGDCELGAEGRTIVISDNYGARTAREVMAFGEPGEASPPL
jgi:hypothetical protein